MSSSSASAAVAPLNLPFCGVSPDAPITTADGTTACAVNAAGQVVEVHGQGKNLYYCVGTLDVLTFAWGTLNGPISLPGKGADTGYNPAVVVDNSGWVLEAHDSGGVNAGLYYWTGQIGTSPQGSLEITWQGHGSYTKGYTPSMCLTAGGLWVECHASSETGISALWSTVGTFRGGKFSPNKSVSMNNNGVNPSIAVNNAGVVVQVHSNNAGTLYYCLGRLELDDNGDPTGITWTTSNGSLLSQAYTSGANPSVVLTDDNFVYEVHAALFTSPLTEKIDRLWQLVGQVQFDQDGNPTSILWSDYFGAAGQTSYEFDDGSTPWIACNAVLRSENGSTSSVNATAVQTHVGQGAIYGNASLVFDRRQWMTNNRTSLQDKTLKELVLPASHDAGMYLGGPQGGSLLQTGGKTQSLNLLGQLQAGVRWFDLRVALVQVEGSEQGTYYLHHNHVPGPSLQDVLADIATFMQTTPGELVILKFSHYGYETLDADGNATEGPFTQEMLDGLCTLVTDSLQDWLCSAPSTGRLANQPLASLWATNGTVLVVCDGDTTATPPLSVDQDSFPNLFNYRDWNSADPQVGDLTVFDLYSAAVRVDKMIGSLDQDRKFETCAMPQGQLPKFNGGVVTNWTGEGDATWGGFNGWCLNNNPTGQQVPCDLFLLSWTLTTDPAVFIGAHLANAQLAEYIQSAGPNANNQTMNLLYTDYVQWSRSADVAWRLNGLLSPTS